MAEAKREKLEGGKKSKGVDEVNQADSGSDTQKEVKKKGKKGKKEAQDSTDNQDAEDFKKGGRKRGRPSRNQTACTPVPTSTTTGGEDEDNVEWVQCDKCEKWRKLPPHISTDELPDIWNCSMNTWNPSNASCDAAEDKADAHHQEVCAAELRKNHAGKNSYRHLIFGTGVRKPHLPKSERARAAESLFRQAVVSDEQPYPTTQYTKSSAFLPRQSNADKRNAVVENTLSIFDILRQSNLWEDLRTMDVKPTKVLSSSASTWNIPGQKLKTYESCQTKSSTLCRMLSCRHSNLDVLLQTKSLARHSGFPTRPPSRASQAFADTAMRALSFTPSWIWSEMVWWKWLPSKTPIFQFLSGSHAIEEWAPSVPMRLLKPFRLLDA